VAGVLAAAEGARRAGFGRLVCAAESAAEAALAGVEPIPAHHLAEVVGYLRGECEPPPIETSSNGHVRQDVPDLADVRGQQRARTSASRCWRVAYRVCCPR
jgi:predicted ATPase with chaperone activity